MRILKGLAALVAFSAISVTTTAAVVAFDNFDPAAPDGGTGSIPTWNYNQPFTATMSGTVTTIDLGGIRQAADHGPLRIRLLDGVLGTSLGFVDIPYASVPASFGVVTADFTAQNIYIVAGNSYDISVETNVPVNTANPTGFFLRLPDDYLAANPALVVVNQTGISGTFDSLFFEISVNVEPPVDPTGYPADSGLRVWQREFFVHDLDGDTATVSNTVPMATTQIVPGFEYADGVYYASARVGASLLNLDPATGALNSSTPFSGFPAGYDVVHAMEQIGGTMYAMIGAAGSDGPDARLATLNTATGVLTDIGATGMGSDAGGLAYYNGVAYTVGADIFGTADSVLHTIDLATGVATPVGPIIDVITGNPVDLTGLEFGYDGILYGLNKFLDANPTDRLYAIDPATGYAFDRGAIGPLSSPVQLTSLTAVPPSAPVGNGANADMRVAQRSPPSAEYHDGLYYIGNNDGPLDTSDPTTGASLNSVAMTGFPASYNRVLGLEMIGNRLYAMMVQAGTDTTLEPQLARLDPTTGVLTPLGPSGIGLLGSGGLAYYNGVAYTTNAIANTPDSNLYTINLATGAATHVAPVIDVDTGLGMNLTGLEFGVDGVLYGLNKIDIISGTNNLYAIDPLTGFAHFIGDIGLPTGAELTSLTAAPVGPAGNGIDPELKTMSQFAVFHDIDWGLLDLVNVVIGSVYSSQFEYHDGLYYIGNNDGPLDTSDPTTGAHLASLPLAYPAGYSKLFGMEFVGDTLYAMLGNIGDKTTPAMLATVDTTTGVITPIGAAGLLGPTAGLAYYAGTMYSAETGGRDATLYTIDLGTGVANPVAPIIEAGFGTPLRFTGLEFGADGVLYGLQRLSFDSIDEALFSIDTNTGLAYRITDFPTNTSHFWSLTAAPIDPELWVLDTATSAGNNTEYRPIDVHTPIVGAITPVATPVYTTAFEHGFGSFFMSGVFGNGQLHQVEAATGLIINSYTMVWPPEGNTIKSMEFVGSTLYGGIATQGSGGSPSYFVRIDLLPGVVSVIGPMGFNGGSGGLAWDGTTMYTLNASGANATLYTVNLATGAATPVGTVINAVTGATIKLTALEFGNDGLLYAMGNDLDDAYGFYIIDTATAIATQLGNLSPLLSNSGSITAISACSGDLDGDGDVDGADLGLFLATWGPGYAVTDYDNDGDVDGADLGLFLAQWGPCP
jgi:hypothetical protein